MARGGIHDHIGGGFHRYRAIPSVSVLYRIGTYRAVRYDIAKLGFFSPSPISMLNWYKIDTFQCTNTWFAGTLIGTDQFERGREEEEEVVEERRRRWWRTRTSQRRRGGGVPEVAQEMQ
ncbi:hypothetical protein BHE74_00017511 [Ensete ventricosum]|nr:hypothetical protein GW17_00007971 [Ensete ventricosum]RWW74546.1 hypothetical protein BHE74_00017511 [Ensete ventricosum]RZR81497.1 hypothetical protein BHM03_00007739 [Ensete ventricosum]